MDKEKKILLGKQKLAKWQNNRVTVHPEAASQPTEPAENASEKSSPRNGNDTCSATTELCTSVADSDMAAADMLSNRMSLTTSDESYVFVTAIQSPTPLSDLEDNFRPKKKHAVFSPLLFFAT